ncbi:Acetamidase/Formamidase [Hymenopellis radicata]|nr:Acetamidase/Formamidase [Hymenopellis radicata]
MSIHSVKRNQTHLAWDNSIAPVITVASGDTITFDCLDASNDQVNGPVYINSASPGDTLQIDVISITTADWGWSALIPGFGLLHDEFPEPALRIWDLKEGYAYTREGEASTIPKKIRLRPFAGEMGVAPGKPGAFSTIPPYNTGGNVDTKHLSVGSKLFLPVEVEGALFSIGDGHGIQGDGEVCGTAIETPMSVTVRLTVLKDKPFVKTPHFLTSSLSTSSEQEQYYCTTGVDPDIREATRGAVRNMISYLCAEHKMNRVDAYMLCSIAGDLRMHEVVDMPNYVIGMMVPLSVLN